MFVVFYYLCQDGYGEVYGPFTSFESARAYVIKDGNAAVRYLTEQEHKKNIEFIWKDNKWSIAGWYSWEIMQIQNPE